MIPGWFASYLLVVILWGGSYGLTEVALTTFSPGQVALWRALLGAGCLLALVLANGEGLPRLGRAGLLRILLLAGLTTAAGVSAAAAQQRMSSGIVAVLCATAPLFAVFLDRLTAGRTPAITWVGVGLGSAGVAVLLSPSGHIDGLAVALSLGAAGSVALAGFLARAFFAESGFSGSQLTTVQLSFSGLLLIGAAPHHSAPGPAAGPMLALAALGVLGAAVGNVLFWRVLREAGPLVASTTYQTVPLVAVVIGVVFLGESFGLGEVSGAALILTGLAAMLAGKRRVLKFEDTEVIDHKGRFTDRPRRRGAASLTTSPETTPAQRKTKVGIMTITITRIAAGLIVAAGVAVGAAPLAAAEAGSNANSASQSEARTSNGQTGLNGNLPGRVASDTGFDQFGHLPFNPAIPGGD